MPVQTPIPDDNYVSVLPSGQVDYLSHNWKEEDVWRSWRNMTRQKNEIANGPRLENASWRTWWKQRNKLKTISPETLNWLKDSDVTWLYGPLHTAVDWSPPPKPPSPPTTVEKDLSTQDRLDLAYTKKPILKHRSIGELLLGDFHNSPLYHPNDSPPFDLFHEEKPVAKEDHEEEPVWFLNEDHGDSDMRPIALRPLLVHTKSDTQVQLAEQALRVNRESPPALLADRRTSDESTTLLSHVRQAAGDIDGAAKRKHISFNTFVEQCIAIDSPSKLFPSGSTTPRAHINFYDDGYEEDSEGCILEEEEEEEDDESYTPRNYFSATVSDEEEDDDEVLEIRTAHTLQRPRSVRSSSSSSSGSSRSRSNPRVSGARTSVPFSTRSSSTGAFQFDHILVRTPSYEKEHITIAPIAPTLLKTMGSDVEEDAIHHGRPERWDAINKNADLDLVYLPPSNSNYSTPSTDMEEYLSSRGPYFRSEGIYTSSGGSAVVITPPSPAPPRNNASGFLNLDAVPSPGEQDLHDPYDYFGGPDLGETFPRIRRFREKDPLVRSSMYVANGPAAQPDAERSRSRSVTKSDSSSRVSRHSRSRSHSRTPSPAEGSLPSSSSTPITVNLPRVRSSGFLAAPDTSPLVSTRGRQPSGSTEGQARGRSSTRSSSFSDRDRSSSRSTSSPLGSLSPDGSAGTLNRSLYNGIYASDSARGRRTDSSSRSHSSGSTSTEETSTGPSSHGRTSPLDDSAIISASCSSDESTSSTILPDADKRDLSTSTITSISQTGPDISLITDVENRRSQHPTPSNSPTPTPLTSKRSSLNINRPPIPSPVRSDQTVQGIVTAPSSTAHQPMRPGTQQAAPSLVGRTMNMANAILGSMWH